MLRAAVLSFCAVSCFAQVIITPPSGGGAGSPGGSPTQLQYNNASAFGGISGATTNGTIVTLTTPAIITSGDLTNSALGTVPAGGYTLTNGTGAGLGTQQVSPPVVWTGSGWGTTGSAPQNVAFRAYALPIQGTNPTGNLLFQSNINNAGYNTIFGINSTFGGATPAIYFGSQPSTGFSGGVNVLWAIAGNTAVAEFNSSSQVLVRSIGLLAFNSGNLGSGAADTMMSRNAAATLQHGGLDTAAPIAQTVRFQGVTGIANVAGVNATIKASAGSGSGIGGDLIFQVARAGTIGGTTPNTYTTAFTLSGTSGAPSFPGFTFATLPTTPANGTMLYCSDCVGGTFDAAAAGGGSGTNLLYENGAWTVH